jgi:hypothetical protein
VGVVVETCLLVVGLDDVSDLSLAVIADEADLRKEGGREGGMGGRLLGRRRGREGGRKGGVGRTGTWHSWGVCLNLSIVPRTKAMTDRKMHAFSIAEMRRAV